MEVTDCAQILQQIVGLFAVILLHGECSEARGGVMT